jgi:hypothetical protein
MIGVILLIGIVKKNAILMIDFALEAKRSRNANARAAIFQACMLRFRPIMMTTMVAIAGAVPLALSFGDGAEIRRPLGISIVGGSSSVNCLPCTRRPSSISTSIGSAPRRGEDGAYCFRGRRAHHHRTRPEAAGVLYLWSSSASDGSQGTLILLNACLGARWGAPSRCGVEDNPGPRIDGGLCVAQRMGAHVWCSQLGFGRRHHLRRRAETSARTIPTLRDADGPLSAPAVRTSDWAYAHVGVFIADMRSRQVCDVENFSPKLSLSSPCSTTDLLSLGRSYYSRAGLGSLFRIHGGWGFLREPWFVGMVILFALEEK